MQFFQDWSDMAWLSGQRHNTSCCVLYVLKTNIWFCGSPQIVWVRQGYDIWKKMGELGYSQTPFLHIVIHITELDVHVCIASYRQAPQSDPTWHTVCIFTSRGLRFTYRPPKKNNQSHPRNKITKIRSPILRIKSPSPNKSLSTT